MFLSRKVPMALQWQEGTILVLDSDVKEQMPDDE